MIDTRRSVFLTLPECFRMESRRAITGELATDGHALIDGNVKSLRSVDKWNTIIMMVKLGESVRYILRKGLSNWFCT